ncbi:hypothetical protein PTKIN_Ptkin02bG0031800 [Pterospermum kingtungense]
MAKSFIFLIMALLLLRVTAQSRPLSTPHSHTPVSSPESSLIGDDGCKSMDGDEECLIFFFGLVCLTIYRNQV